ncbi:CLUMA_CG020214, isoform A [Clunio marinus]|uniref:CLUMA_CG020214, isoform A n=1 Tax=Clunio marinus TaxID=568069 RepID=A0A1J1J5K7_9DIPT|nr:CLUMA_CG020214, isoform A [Clunio marinus]
MKIFHLKKSKNLKTLEKLFQMMKGKLNKKTVNKVKKKMSIEKKESKRKYPVNKSFKENKDA